MTCGSQCDEMEMECLRWCAGLSLASVRGMIAAHVGARNVGISKLVASMQLPGSEDQVSSISFLSFFLPLYNIFGPSSLSPRMVITR